MMRDLVKTPTLFALVLAGALAAPCLQAATITVDSGGFEDEDSQVGNWANLDTAWENGVPAGIEYEQNNGDNMPPDTGQWSAYVASAAPFSQDLTTSVNIGDTLSVTFRGGKAPANPHGTTGGGVFTATFDVGGTDYTSTYDTTLNTSNWETFTLTKTITNAGNLTLEFGHVSGHAFLDNVSDVTLTPVPEPASLGLLALAGLGLVRRRRA